MGRLIHSTADWVFERGTMIQYIKNMIVGDRAVRVFFSPIWGPGGVGELVAGFENTVE